MCNTTLLTSLVEEILQTEKFLFLLSYPPTYFCITIFIPILYSSQRKSSGKSNKHILNRIAFFMEKII